MTFSDTKVQYRETIKKVVEVVRFVSKSDSMKSSILDCQGEVVLGMNKESYLTSISQGVSDFF